MSTENTAPGILESVLAAVLHGGTQTNEQSDKLDRLLAIADELLALVRAHNADRLRFLPTPAVKAAETGAATPAAAAQQAAPVAAPVAPVVPGESPQFAATKAAINREPTRATYRAIFPEQDDVRV